MYHIIIILLLIVGFHLFQFHDFRLRSKCPHVFYEKAVLKKISKTCWKTLAAGLFIYA